MAREVVGRLRIEVWSARADVYGNRRWLVVMHEGDQLLAVDHGGCNGTDQAMAALERAIPDWGDHDRWSLEVHDDISIRRFKELVRYWGAK